MNYEWSQSDHKIDDFVVQLCHELTVYYVQLYDI